MGSLCSAWAIFSALLVGAPIVQSKLGIALPRLRLSVQDFGKPFGQSRSVDWISACVSSHCGDVAVQCAFVSASDVDSFGLSVPPVGPRRGWVPGRGSWACVGLHPSSPAVGPGRGWAPTSRRRPWVPGVGGPPSAVAGRGSSCSLALPAVRCSLSQWELLCHSLYWQDFGKRVLLMSLLGLCALGRITEELLIWPTGFLPSLSSVGVVRASYQCSGEGGVGDHGQHNFSALQALGP